MTSQTQHSAAALKAQEANRIHRGKNQILSERRAAMQVIRRCCMLCDHMTPNGKISNNVADAVCNKFGTVPPLKVMTIGCSMFVDEIPF